jgi:FkbM family methyltransferase
MLRFALQRLLSLCFIGSEGIPILVGPLAGTRLPRYIALSNISLVFRSYEPSVVSEIMGLPSSIRVAYDIGAHVGLLTMVLAKKVGPQGKILSFEPCPSNVAPLRDLVRQNNLQKLVDVLDVAVADYDGEAMLLVGDTPYMHKLQTLENEGPAHSRQSFTARAIAIDTLVFKHGYPPPQLIKVDVEGAEALVIKGTLETLKRYSPYLLLEIHGPSNVDTIWDMLLDLGYEWKALRNKSWSKVSRQQARSFFSAESWTNHFLLTGRSVTASITDPVNSHMLSKEASL